MTHAFLGVDIGTSGIKLIVVDAAGVVLARASAGYASSSPVAGWVEQDPRAWTDGLARTLGTIDPTIRAQVNAIGTVGHVPTLVLTDDHGRALRPAITWQDTRASDEARDLGERLGPVQADLGVDLPWSPSQLIPKLAWVAAHEPGIQAGTRWILQPKDYVNRYLTSVAATDPWSSKGVTDVRDGLAASRLLSAAGWTDDACPPARAPWEALAAIAPGVADDLGLDRRAVVATGWSDALGAVLAVGAFDSPRGFILTGTSNIVGVSRDAGALADGLYSVPAGPAAPLPLLYGPTQSGGESLQWGARLLGVAVPELVELAASVAPRDAPTFVPYLRGERTPLWDADLRALIAGIGVDHGRAEFARAIIDGVAFSARHVLELAAGTAGAGSTPVEVGGLGVEAQAWADALGRPVRVHSEPNLSALGAAMLAAWASGWSRDDLARLRPHPVEFAPSGSVPDDAAYRDYLDASRVAQEWSSRDRAGH